MWIIRNHLFYRKVPALPPTLLSIQKNYFGEFLPMNIHKLVKKKPVNQHNLSIVKKYISFWKIPAQAVNSNSILG